jgi:hypothetical protein
MTPKAAKAPRVSHTFRFPKSIHRIMEISTEKMIKTPPMVGVPPFFRWLSGPSSRTDWPILSRRRASIIRGPSIKQKSSVVRAA